MRKKRTYTPHFWLGTTAQAKAMLLRAELSVFPLLDNLTDNKYRAMLAGYIGLLRRLGL